MTDSPLVNGEILAAAQEKLKDALKMRLARKDRIQFEILQLIVIFIAEDHPKVQEMHPVFRWGRWAVAIIVAAFLAACATGRVMITFVN